MSPKATKPITEPFIQIPTSFYEEILLRKINPVPMNILFLIARLIEGCYGSDEKNTKDGAITIYRQGCIMLQKKGFELLGVSEQRSNIVIKDFIQKNVINEEIISLTINKKLQNVYCYSINPDYSSWNVPYAEHSEKFKKLLHANLCLQPMQIAKINNVTRYKQLLMKLKNISPFEYILEAWDCIFDKENELRMSDFFIFPALGKDYSVLIGTKNIITDKTINMIIATYPGDEYLFATFILDLQLLLEIKTVENQDIEEAMLEIANNPAPALTEIGNYWAENIAKPNEKQKFYDSFSTNLNQVLSLCNESYQEESASEVNYSQNFEQEDYNNDPD